MRRVRTGDTARRAHRSSTSGKFYVIGSGTTLEYRFLRRLTPEHPVFAK
jgi:hypothetical protein